MFWSFENLMQLWKKTKKEKKNESGNTNHSCTIKQSEADKETLLAEHKDMLKNVIAENDLVVLFYHANWCGPCRLMSSSIREWCAKHNAVLLELNTDKIAVFAYCVENEIKNIPYTQLYINNELKFSVTGAFNTTILTNERIKYVYTKDRQRA